MATLRAGFARREITPPIGAPLMHNLQWRNESVTDPLFATALVLDDGERRAVVVGTDLCGILARPHREFREAAGEAIGVDPAEVVLNVSHSHAAPYVSSDLHEIVAPYGRQVVTPEYVASVRDAIADAAVEALARAEPAVVAVGRAIVHEVGANRRPTLPDGRTVHRYGRPPADLQALPEGLIDPWVTGISFERPGGGTIGTVVGYTCHLTARETQPRAASADFIAPARRAIEADTGAPMLFLQGCAGNVGTGKYVRGNGEEAVELLGGRLAEGIRRAVEDRAEISATPLAALARRVEVELDPIAPLPELEAELEARMRSGEFVAAAGVGDRMIVARTVEEARRAPVIGIALGDLAICALPGEVFIEFGLQVQRDSPFRHTLVAAYSDNTLQYIPTREAFAGGEYEVDGGWRYTSPVGGEQLAAGATAVLADLHASMAR
jgi:hypothetical protein